MAQKKKYKTMMVREEIWRKLGKHKRAGESYSDLLARLCDLAVEVDNAGGITSKLAHDLMEAIGRLTREITEQAKQPSPAPPTKQPEKKRSSGGLKSHNIDLPGVEVIK